MRELATREHATTGRAMTGRANRRRGEIEAVFDGERRILCLTLGALAELETAFAIDNLNELAARFSRGGLSARDIIRILGAGFRGGGNLFSDEDVGGMTADGGLEAAARAVAELLVATFGAGDGAGDRRAGAGLGPSSASHGTEGGDAGANPTMPHPAR